MTPIKLTEFLEQTAPKAPSHVIDLTALGLFHAAPRENGQALLELSFDASTGTLVPAA